MSSKKTNRINISATGPILPGTISIAMSKCGKKTCKCKANPPQLHGPYFRWTGLIDGKPTTKTISKNIAEECKRRIKKYRQFQKEIKVLVAAAISNAPWSEK